MAAMTKQEMTRAMTLLEEDDLEELAKIKVGKWAITTENGIYGIYETKSEAIEDALARQMQTRNHAKVTRFGKGAYTLGILDCDEDPGERLYHYHTLRRITPANLLEHKEAAICSMLPDWYFNPYSQEYKKYFEVGMEQND